MTLNRSSFWQADMFLVIDRNKWAVLDFRRAEI